MEDASRCGFRGRDSGRRSQGVAQAAARRIGSGNGFGRSLTDCQIAERSVRQYVQQRNVELEMKVRETFVPQSYAWGGEAQIDWYEAWADLVGEGCRCSRYGAVARRSTSPIGTRRGRRFWKRTSVPSPTLVRCFVNSATNLTTAMKKIRFIAFRSHRRFEVEFCTPAQSHEKRGRGRRSRIFSFGGTAGHSAVSRGCAVLNQLSFPAHG